ncbi:hypothetical protein B0A48_18133 [Cryoendolithus antarcticus]|uniref:Uncharacterized protein n=1 Tax=Cryoendolithus antarcticus TaxID=1507870 RepID=A0A1V8S9F9_9PEZI|nr:hypothetical protein B0A48_18133 [Cryoendolithus antarcticus]
MPKAPKPKTVSSRTSPLKAPIQSLLAPLSKQPRAKDPKTSHLYTDDNPATTIHGTGFKDLATAKHTLEIISRRSLTYQFQTVNTMYHRAAHHPSVRGGPTASNANIREAMDVFRIWLDETYPNAKAALRVDGFKPLLGKGSVAKWLPVLHLEGDPDAKRFADFYVALGKAKRLANVLVDDSKPTEADWEVKRYAALDALVPEGRESGATWTDAELWVDREIGPRKPSELHSKMIAWAWSPLSEKKLK